MTANTSQSSSLGSVSFLNIFGVFISIVLCVLFIILGGHALKYIKEFACKIKIIVNRAQDKNVQLKDYNYKVGGEKQRSEAYEQLEVIYKNEIKKSRSLQYWMIVKNLIAKYDHIIYYPFRDKVLEQYDMLKPKTSFYTLLVVCSCCIAWMTTIFLSAILQNSYSDVTLIPMSTFVGITIAIAIISSGLNIIATNRLFRIYLLTLKASFKVDYGLKFNSINQGLKEYEPENSDEENEIFKHQDKLKHFEIITEDLDNQKRPELVLSNDIQVRKISGINEYQNIDSSRKLLHDDMDRSDKALLPHQSQDDYIASQNQSFNNSNNGAADGPSSQHLQESGFTPNPIIQSNLGQNASTMALTKVRSKAIKDIFELQVDIEGADDANTEDKYIFIEDKHAMGDLDLLENEALKGENQSNVITFAVLFVIIAVASGVCCYLNYTFQTALARYVFYMFIASFFGDIIVSRPIALMIYAMFKYCIAAKQGYKKVEYKSPKDIKDVFNKAIKDMFANRRKYREEQIELVKFGSSRKPDMMKDQSAYSLNPKGDRSQDLMMSNYEHLTQNNDRQDTSMRRPLDEHEHDHDQEDQFAREIINKHDDDADGSNKINMNTHITRTNPTEFAKPLIEDEQKNFEKTQNITQYNTSVPLLSNLKQAIREKEEEKFSNIMEQKQLHNELVDYNLLLLRKIYDAYEERADKVIKNFRKDNRGVLRKRYMVPVLNPNYDYEKLLKEMMEKGKGAKEDFEEESVKLDGQTVCEDFEQQLMEAIIQEAQDDLVDQRVDRQKIDKFGNPIDDDKLNNGVIKACPMPSYGLIEQECEDNQVEDDEYARRMKMLEDLRRRLANGEELTAEELALLEELENERLKELEKLIQDLLNSKGGYDKLTDEEKLTLIGYQKEKCHILLDQEKRKKPRTKENEMRIDELNEELKRLELEELKLRQKLYGLSAEELDRLYQLEQERLDKMRKRIAELENKGWDNLSNDEKFELLGLKKGCLNIELDRLNRKQPPLSEEDLLRIKDIKEELKRLELEELLLKEKLGLLTVAEKQRLQQLKDYFAQLERDRELSELEALRKKLLDGTITEEELRRLRELEAKYGLEPISNPFEQQIQMNEEFDNNMQDDEEKQEVDDEEDIMHSRITDQDNFMDLPPVEVMNNPNQSPGKLLNDLENADGADGADGADANADDLEAQQKMLDQQQLLDANQQQQQQQNNIDQFNDGANGIHSNNPDDIEAQQNLMLSQQQQQEQYKLDQINGNNGDGVNQQDNADDLSRIEKQNQLDDSNIDPNLLVMHNQNQDDFNTLNDSQQDLTPEERERLRQQQQLEQERLDQEARDQMLRDQQMLDDQQLNQQQQQQQHLDDDEMNFGRDDLEDQLDNAAAIAADGESIYSHKTSAILDEEKVSFMHIDHLQNEEVNSDESFAEQDMVYYDKDDLTRFSENRGINRVKRRQAPQYFSENDLQEVKEGDFSEGDSVSGRSAGGRSRATMGRGYQSHNQLETQSHEDLIEGRVKVDAWNLNYRKKKKKQKKRKVTDNAMRKMHDLQEIYGVDARTLANLKKGPLPRKQLAKKGKMTDDDFNQGPQSRMMSDNSFRTTMNTFQQNAQQTPAARMQQSIADNQSNMFSFNGFGATRQNWGNGMKESRFDMNSQYGKNSTNKKYPLTGMKKVTETQQRFNNHQGPGTGQFTGRDRNIADFLDEESKSAYSASRSRGASNNRFNGSNGLGSMQNNKTKNNGKGKKGTKKGKSPKKNQRLGSDGLDSHTESDEAVDDKGAMFQRRNKFNDFYGRGSDDGGMQSSTGFRGGRGGMNDDLDHSESEEGNNQDIPNFQGNDFMFKKRGAVENSQMNANANKNSKLNGKSASKSKIGQSKASKKGGNKKRGSGDELNIEDLEAQSVQMKTGKKGNQSSMKKGNGYRGSSAERQDSEEENDGGQIMFQKRNLNGDYQNSDLDRSGLGKGKSNGKLNTSTSKPPLSGRRQKRAGGSRNGDLDDEEEQKLYGQQYNINGRVHPGVSNSIRHQNAGYGFNDGSSDNERQFRGTKYSNPLESDGDIMGGSNAKKRGGNLGAGMNNTSSGMFNSINGNGGRMSDQMLHPSQNNRRANRGGMNTRSDNGRNSDNEDDYIVGPESNHSSIKKRPFNAKRGSHNNADDDEHYLLMQRERQIIEDIESERGNDSSNLLAKKRKIRKAGKSQNVRDAQQLRYQELQRERLKKMKREAEGALFSQENDLESGKAQLKKKKKVKKEIVKKEINYWLDYDSPYAEYLVARFREWSPNPNLVRHPSANAQQRNSMERSKYSEVANVYSKNAAASHHHNNNGRSSSNANSRSRERDARNKASLNNSAQKFKQNNNNNGNGSQMRMNGGVQSQLSNQNNNLLGSDLGQNRNHLFVDDFEEP